MGPAAWHRTLPTRGTFSHMTSEEFYQHYASAYDKTKVSYHGAANFAAMCALAEVKCALPSGMLPPWPVSVCVRVRA